MLKDRNARQELFFRKEGQEKIEAVRVGIVGLGGTGSQVAQALVYLGVLDFLLIDDDRVESTNLNRLIGAYPADVENKTLKTEVAERMIKQINPDVNTKPLDYNLRSKEALEALMSCNYVFGCVDNEGSRLILMELAAAYEIVFIDVATEILPVEEDKPLEYGGRVIVSRPSDFCLGCADQINMEEAKQDLELPEAREARRAHGYGLGKGVAPSVVSLNGVVANLAVTEFLVMVTGLRSPNRLLTYYADRYERGIVNSRLDKRKDDCYICGYVVGKREEANILRYVLDDRS